MADVMDIAQGAVILGIVIGGYFLVKQLTSTGKDIIEGAENAGRWTGQYIVDPTIKSYRKTTSPIVAAESNYELVGIPKTPEGYNSSNWTWNLGGGVMAGLPEGWTPERFCAENRDAPMCAEINKKGQNIFGQVANGMRAIGITPWWSL